MHCYKPVFNLTLGHQQGTIWQVLAEEQRDKYLPYGQGCFLCSGMMGLFLRKFSRLGPWRPRGSSGGMNLKDRVFNERAIFAMKKIIHNEHINRNLKLLTLTRVKTHGPLIHSCPLKKGVQT